MSHYVRTGGLNKFIDIETRALTTTGEPTTTWEPLPRGTNVPASIMAVTGGERIRGQQIEATATSLIELHFFEEITTKMRVKFGDRLLNIVRAYDPDGGRCKTFLQCKEIA